MAAVRDSNRWAQLEERKDYQDRMRHFVGARAGMESGSFDKDARDDRILNSQKPTPSKKADQTRKGARGGGCQTIRKHGLGCGGSVPKDASLPTALW